MKVSIDTNVWIFGIVGTDEFSEKILLNLSKFRMIIPDQVREELERNLSPPDMNRFYRLWELRVDEYRVFYNVDETEKLVIIRAVRHKPPHKTTKEIL